MGSPKANSEVACPRPHAKPRAPARRAARSLPEATRVVTAARWSGSLACRRPSTIETRTTTRSVVPSESEAIRSSSPNTSGHLRERARRHGDAGDEDHERAHGREEADEAALERLAGEELLREDGHEPDARDREREAGAEGHDQEQAERDAVERDRGQEHDERRRARQEAAGDADADEGAPAEAPVPDMVVVMVVVVVVVAAYVGATMSYPGHEDGRADPDDEQARGEVEPRVQPGGHDELGQGERHQAEGEHPDGVRRGHDQPEQRRVERRPAAPDQVGGDD